MLWGGAALAQPTPPGERTPDAAEAAAAEAEPAPASARVDVDAGPSDAQIEQRLQRILAASEWFEQPSVRVEEGIVFLEGSAPEERQRKWAGDLARRTEGVVAVVNRIELSERSLTDLGPALEGLEDLWASALRSAPLLLMGGLVLGLAYAVGRVSSWVVRGGFERRGGTDLVRDLVARGAGLLLFTLGAYVALRVAGLTRLAATVLGGTGIIGLVLGIAFRDIAENTLASILLTRQRPFQKGDLVQIGGIEGVVERLTVRATVLMSLDGNHVQIPNSTVYKSAIVNFTSNPTRRIDFAVGIGYGESIARAQDIALSVIAQHPALLREPEPWVLAEALDSAVVRLRVYVWLDVTRHSWLKVRSSVIRLVKREFQAQGVSMPDEAREVLFPEGVNVRLVEDSAGADRPGAAAPRPVAPAPRRDEADSIATGAEAGLDTDATSIRQMARRARTPESGEDLLAG